jgi:hypothetical protein
MVAALLSLPELPPEALRVGAEILEFNFLALLAPTEEE